MRFQLKVSALVLAVVFVTATAIIWKTQNQVVADKLSFVADSSIKQIAPLKRLIDEKLSGAQRDLVRFAASRAVNGPGRETDFGTFDVIALIESSGGAPVATWIERGASARAESWPAKHELTLLKSLPYARVRDGQRYWARVADGRGSAVFALVVPVEVKSNEEPASSTAANLPDVVGTSVPVKRGGRAFIVGFATQNPLASITEDFIGSTNNVYIVDDRGYVASHVDKSYNGALFTEDPIVGEIIKGQKGLGTGRYEDLESRPVIGHFEKVDDSNLTAIISTPVRSATMGADDHLQTAIFTALAVALVAAIGAWFAGGMLAPPTRSGPIYDLGSRGLPPSLRGSDDDDEPVAPVRTIPMPPQTPAFVAPPPSGQLPPAVVVSALKNEASLQNERKNAYEAFQQGLAKQMREPLLSIIGHAQLIRANASGDERVEAHVESIERDARSAKESLDRLRLFEETELPLERDETFDLDDVIARTLEAKDIDLQAAGVTVDRGIASLPRLRGRASDFSEALGHMIDNAIEAMRERPVRRLTIKTELNGDTAILSVGDTGIGMSRDVKNRAFEPFFKNFESPLHMGLGLAFVHAVANRADVKCEIDSSPGEGTRVLLKFPVQIARTEASPPPLDGDAPAIAESAAPAPKRPSTPPPQAPRVPPPAVAMANANDDEDDAFQVVASSGLATSEERARAIEENVQRLLTLGGRGPLESNVPLPPMPYPSLQRPSEDEGVLPIIAMPEPAAVTPIEEPIEDVSEDTISTIKVIDKSVIHQFGDEQEQARQTAPITTPAPEPVAPEAIAPSEMDEREPMNDFRNESEPKPEAVASGPRPFRVRIRPPRTRGPSSQA